ncbi:MDR family MFS transporter [Brevibacterium daeguense]|uniref:MDR family MFS transporter n=2 Tax=Brevibacterium daeguense TaxID=909936 RepID=A0ABP8EMV5_9MICO
MTAARSGKPPASGPEATAGAEMSRTAILLLFIGLMVSMFMFSLNQTVLATALPTIVGELDGVDLMLWVSTAFMLASTIMMPVYGKIGDLFGRKPLFIFAIVMFMFGSLLAMLAQDMMLLIAGRVFQGIGGGGMMILSQAIIAAVVPARQRGKYMGIMGSVFAVSSVAGPLIGGWLTDGPGWRWAFAINFPLGIFAIVAAALFLKIPRVTHEKRPKIDIGGMVLVAIFTSSVILVSAWGGHQYAWDSPVILGMIAAALVAGIAFVFVERRVSEPVIPMTLFRDRNFVLATCAGLTIGVAMFGVLSYMPTYLQMVHGIDATVAGLMMVPMMGTMLVSSTAVGFIVARTGRYKAYPIVGMVLIVTALVFMSFMKADSHAVWSILHLAGLGLGLGLSMQLLVLIVQNSFPIAIVGTATAANNFFRQIGATLGMAVIGALFTSRLMSNLSAVMPTGAGAQSANRLTPEAVSQMTGRLHDAVVTGYNDALMPLFLWVAPLPLIGLVFVLFIKEIPLATRIDRASVPPRAVVAKAPADPAHASLDTVDSAEDAEDEERDDDGADDSDGGGQAATRSIRSTAGERRSPVGDRP